MQDQEQEIKLYVRDLAAIRESLESAGAHLEQPRTREINLRFDTRDARLARTFRVLRLRYDTEARMTFKGPAQSDEGVRIRQEIEFRVESFEKARRLLEALEFEIKLIYEKFRSMYVLGDVQIALDEMPYGNFVEIEGPGVEAIRSVNERLGLNWEAFCSASYTALFEQLKEKKGLDFRDLVFENFVDLDVSAEDLGVVPADEIS